MDVPFPNQESAMTFLELAQQRRSVRAYLDTPVPDTLLEYILEAGRWAPSACNIQPWLFIIIKDPASRQALKQVYARDWFLNAPVILAVCCDHSSSWKRSDGKDFGDIDSAIVLDHITLAAAEKGLGTCWIGNFNAQAARLALNTPEHIDPFAFTPVGFPSTQPPRPKSRKSLSEIIHHNRCGDIRQG
jgi:nitroreductase